MNAAALLALLTVTPMHVPHGAAVPAAHRPPPDRPTAVCDPAVLAAMDELDDALRHLDDELSRIKGKRHKREHLSDDLAAAMAAARQARVASCRAQRVPPVVVVEPPSAMLLDDHRHRLLVAALRQQTWDEERLNVLALGVRDVCMTSVQARALVDEMSFAEQQVAAVRVIAPRIVDPAQSWHVLEAMTFDADKRRARDILATTSTAPACAVTGPVVWSG